ncbi:hypothetical protein [Rathayibacter sp. VKM Ac-2760]|uniref:hypothetical protein n=1 Tax=Rathayibacter sp. VKM Ac-2760 TaxID=2609253 RepID=UPI001316B4DF|nr:hypothetical protein [Rathayibacter sp. VKM Ac-2760]QHC57722.1 hypothetical protein GSU72_03385 [Rathayibacter sp. VKM Ac-2760]
MILLRTHSNRWVARARRTGVVVGLITLAADLPHPVFRTVRLDGPSGERVLLRDTDTLEVAFAVLIAAVERARLAEVAAPAQNESDPAAQAPLAPVSVLAEPDTFEPDEPTDPLEDAVAA